MTLSMLKDTTGIIKADHFYLVQFLAESMLLSRSSSEHSWVVLVDHFYSLKILLCKGLMCLKIYYLFIYLFIYICQQ